MEERNELERVLEEANLLEKLENFEKENVSVTHICVVH